MKILLVAQRPYLKRSWLVQEKEILASLGHEVETLGLPYLTPNPKYFLWMLFHLSVFFHADVIFEWFAHPSIVFISRALGRPIIANAVGKEVTPYSGASAFYRALVRIGLEHCQGVMAESKETARLEHCQGVMAESKETARYSGGEVIYEGIDSDSFYPREHQFTNTIVSIAALSENNVKRKDLPSLVKAFSLLGNGTKLEVIGEKGSGFESLSSSSKGLNVEFTGAIPQSELLARLQRASLFVMPSLQEGFPTVACEAMLCKVPVITTDIPPMNEVFTPIEALLVPPKDVQKLAEAMKLLLEDQNLADSFSQNGFIKVKGTYSKKRRERELHRYFASRNIKEGHFSFVWLVIFASVCILGPFFRNPKFT